MKSVRANPWPTDSHNTVNSQHLLHWLASPYPLWAAPANPFSPPDRCISQLVLVTITRPPRQHPSTEAIGTPRCGRRGDRIACRYCECDGRAWTRMRRHMTSDSEQPTPGLRGTGPSTGIRSGTRSTSRSQSASNLIHASSITSRWKGPGGTSVRPLDFMSASTAATVPRSAAWLSTKARPTTRP